MNDRLVRLSTSSTRKPRKTGGQFASANKRGKNRPRSFVLDGVAVEMISFGQACESLGLSKKTFRRYEDTSTVPNNRLVDHHGRRWYLPEFVEFLKPLLVDQSDRREPLWSIKARVEQAWQSALADGSAPVLPMPSADEEQA